MLKLCLSVCPSVLRNQKTASIPGMTRSPQDTWAGIIDHREFEFEVKTPRKPIRSPETNGNRASWEIPP